MHFLSLVLHTLCYLSVHNLITPFLTFHQHATKLKSIYNMLHLLWTVGTVIKYHTINLMNGIAKIVLDNSPGLRLFIVFFLTNDDTYMSVYFLPRISVVYGITRINMIRKLQYVCHRRTTYWMRRDVAPRGQRPRGVQCNMVRPCTRTPCKLFKWKITIW